MKLQLVLIGMLASFPYASAGRLLVHSQVDAPGIGLRAGIHTDEVGERNDNDSHRLLQSSGNYCGSTWTAAIQCCQACPGGVDSECPDGEMCFAAVTCSTTGGGVDGGEAPLTTPSVAGDGSRLIAYMGNWQPCPTAQQYDAYTHIVIAFAVSYQYAEPKNICDETCQISTTLPICNNAPNPTLIQELQAAGKKVILSFGGAGMGGSWDGLNDCWEYCYGKEAEVVNQLVSIVNTMGLDGVDIDYEYYYEDGQNGSNFNKGAEAQQFLTDVTIGLKTNLPVGSIVTHAPMDADAVPGKAYYDVLVNVATSLDFLMPQYYNGVTRPVSDGVDGTGAGSISALQHFTTLTDNVFGGDPTKVVFGFCINACSNWNANGDQAAAVMEELGSTYACNGGAFFWVSNDDVNGDWSNTVSNTIQANAGCSGTPTVPTMPTPVAPTPAPTTPMTPSFTPPTSGGIPGNNCGSSFQDASKCQVSCPQGLDGECPSGESCFASVMCAGGPSPTMPSPTASPGGGGGGGGTTENYCGSTWTTATQCSQACPGGVDSECPSGESCFASVMCTGGPSPTMPSPVASPGGGGGGTTGNYCGSTWTAANQCSQACPGGVDSECPSGESCFASVMCAGGPSPTMPSPVASPGGGGGGGGTTGNYCGSTWTAATQCSQACPGGVDSECPSGETCFGAVTCSPSGN